MEKNSAEEAEEDEEKRSRSIGEMVKKNDREEKKKTKNEGEQ